MGFSAFFADALGEGRSPFSYQLRLAEEGWPETLVVPTGFGKTAAVLGAWLWKVARGDAKTPRRLVYCLPMRTLVEQTEAVAGAWIAAAKRHLGLEVRMHVLMGGRSEGRRGVPDWIREPAQPTVLIGTQDMLVSAALMRGYGTSRYRWPVDFALLNNDALWVFDEVQLTGAALATSAQLEGFRRTLSTGRPCQTLWMSATLDPAWLKTVDFLPADASRPHDLSQADLVQAEHLWTARKSLVRLEPVPGDIGKQEGLGLYANAVAREARARARLGTNTIVFLNTVRRAQAVFDALGDPADGAERLLVHSRFRAADRRRATERLLSAPPIAGRIVVATQALEAGVDVSAAVLMTENAPWSSLVQRFGRCNRYGECGSSGADVLWFDLDDEFAAPYEPGDFDRSREKLATLTGCGPADLAAVPLSPPPRGHVIRKRDLLDLFDTDPDLSGFDVDVSLYVRDAEDTDVRTFWRPVPIEADAPPDDAPAPTRDELCPAPIGGAKALLAGKGVRAWRMDPLAKTWRRVGRDDVFPGIVIWVDAASGGYQTLKGFDPSAKGAVTCDAVPPGAPEGGFDDDPDAYTSTVRVGLAKHSAHVRDQAAALADTLGLGRFERELIVEAALWHDLGKGHAAFVALTAEALRDGVSPPLAKWPTAMNAASRPAGARPYFRHELASALAYLAHQDWAEDASLAAYLIAAHHGKVRMRLRALPKEPQPDEPDRLFARGVHDGDLLPETRLDCIVVPETRLDLDLMRLGDGACGPSWSARAQALLEHLGPFRLAWLEALLRIADWRASEAEEEAGHDDL